MRNTLPEFLNKYFWDCDLTALSFTDHRDFIIRRLLQSGDWQSLTWLRNALGDSELRQWIEQRRGSGLSPQQLRFWEVVLDLPRPQVTRWVHATSFQPWGKRLTR